MLFRQKLSGDPPETPAGLCCYSAGSLRADNCLETPPRAFTAAVQWRGSPDDFRWDNIAEPHGTLSEKSIYEVFIIIDFPKQIKEWKIPYFSFFKWPNVEVGLNQIWMRITNMKI
jgi:hypothetical protein